MTRRDKVLLLEATARKVARRADMPVPDLRLRKLKGRRVAYTSIFYKDRIIVNELAVCVLNRTGQAVMLAHEMGHLKYMWFWRVLAINLILVLSASVSIPLLGIPMDLSRLLFLLLWLLSSVALPTFLEPIANHFAYRLYGKELCRKTFKDVKRKMRGAASAIDR